MLFVFMYVVGSSCFINVICIYVRCREFMFF